MSIESVINYKLNQHPCIKKAIKRIYQRSIYSLSSKISSEGNIVRVSPDDDAEYFFGYYDKSPWDATDRYMLCMRAKNTWSNVAPKEPVELILIDTQKNNTVKKIGESRSWNVQQGCMLQWLGPDFQSKVIYNDFRNGKYCSVVLDLKTEREKLLPMPIYTVSVDGKIALSVDFSRLHRLRPGYGYSNLPDSTKNMKIPDCHCLWRLDIDNGEVTPLLKYTDFACFEPRPEMTDAEHKVNHIMISPNGKRFMVLHRWLNGSRKYTRLLTCNCDGSDMYNLSDDDMVSHCFWKNDIEILAFANKKSSGAGYYLMKDKTSEYTHFWPEISSDGHPSFSPVENLVVTDTYPNRKRMAQIMIMTTDCTLPVARVFAPFKYDNDTRCDLHPRWNRKGNKICFDSAFEEHRGVYIVDVPKLKNTSNEYSGTKTIVYLMTGCRKRGPANQTLNIIKNLDKTKFRPVLVTLYTEAPGDSMIESYLPEVASYLSLRTSLKNIILKDKKRLYSLLDEIKPDVIQSVGLIPARILLGYKGCGHCTTVRNDIYTDYPVKYGALLGAIMKQVNIKVLKECKYVYACSESLSNLYERKLGIKLPYIRNGVDTDIYQAKSNNSIAIKEQLGLPREKNIISYSGAFVPFKDQKFAIEGFLQSEWADNSYLILMGEGPLLNTLRSEYKNQNNIIFTGFTSNIPDYLKVSDLYVSTSQSEGMPNGVLEALSAGLPILLSDIPQHVEILNVSREVGISYILGDINNFVDKLNIMRNLDLKNIGLKCRNLAIYEFSAVTMSKRYQNVYDDIIQNIL